MSKIVQSSNPGLHLVTPTLSSTKKDKTSTERKNENHRLQRESLFQVFSRLHSRRESRGFFFHVQEAFKALKKCCTSSARDKSAKFKLTSFNSLA